MLGARRSTYAEGPRASAAVVFKLFGKVMKMKIGRGHGRSTPHRRCFGSKVAPSYRASNAVRDVSRPRSSMSVWPSAVSWSPRASRRGSAAAQRSVGVGAGTMLGAHASVSAAVRAEHDRNPALHAPAPSPRLPPTPHALSRRRVTPLRRRLVGEANLGLRPCLLSTASAASSLPRARPRRRLPPPPPRTRRRPPPPRRRLDVVPRVGLAPTCPPPRRPCGWDFRFDGATCAQYVSRARCG